MKNPFYTLVLILFLVGNASAAEIVLTWQAGALNPDLGNVPATFNVYRRASAAPYDLLQTIPVVRLADNTITPNWAATDATAVLGVKYCYQVSAANTIGESPASNEACSVAIDAKTIGVDMPTDRLPLVSRRATDGSNIISILVNRSDIVAVNDSTLAVTATVTINTPPGKTVLISHRATDEGTIVPLLINASPVIFINGQSK
jgi:hypothetical protein